MEYNTSVERIKEELHEYYRQQGKELNEKFIISTHDQEKNDKFIQNLQNELKYYIHLYENINNEHNKNVKDALEKQLQEYNSEKQLILELHSKEIINLKQESQKHINSINENMNIHMQSQEKHETEIKHLLFVERSRVENENSALKEQLMQSVAQVCII